MLKLLWNKIFLCLMKWIVLAKMLERKIFFLIRNVFKNWIFLARIIHSVRTNTQTKECLDPLETIEPWLLIWYGVAADRRHTISVDISISWKMDLHSLDLVLVIISCFIVLGVDFTDGQEIIKNRTFVSKARAEFIKVIPPI